MVSSRWERIAPIVLAVAISLAMLGGSAKATDVSISLSQSESRVASAEADIASAETEVDAARAHLATTSRQAGPAAEAAQIAQARARDLRSSLLDRQQRAKARIVKLEAVHRQEVDDYDREVIYGVGIGLAALVGAGIALAWGWFRASSVVAALSQTGLGRALGLCIGGGLLLLIVGAALTETEGLLGAIGAFLLGLGFVLPAALLLGRHSAQIQRGRATPMLKRDRLPSWVARSVAVLLLLLALSGISSSIFAEQPAAFSASARLQAESTALEKGADSRHLEEAKVEADAAQRMAVHPLAQQQAARAALHEVTRELRSAKNRLVSAEADQRRFVRRLAAITEREEREAAEEAARAEREAEELADEEESFSSECDSNYSGCVPAYPPDVDCAEVGETVTVVGSDPHGLDADGDLVACE